MGKVLHAGASGYLPFCIIPASTIPQEVVGTYYPFALSLDQLVSLFWRVKKWTYEDNLGPTGEIFSLFVNIPGPGIQDLPVDEEGLVCIDAYIYFRTFPRDNGNSYLRDFALFSGSVLKVGGLYYPKFYFFGDFRDDSIPISGSGLTPGDIGTFETGIFTMSWLGHSISAPLYSYGGGETFNPKLTATEYWSYGGTYDTSTGAPL
jgi:hypothetical protein